MVSYRQSGESTGVDTGWVAACYQGSPYPARHTEGAMPSAEDGGVDHAAAGELDRLGGRRSSGCRTATRRRRAVCRSRPMGAGPKAERRMAAVSLASVVV